MRSDAELARRLQAELHVAEPPPTQPRPARGALRAAAAVAAGIRTEAERAAAQGEPPRRQAYGSRAGTGAGGHRPADAQDAREEYNLTDDGPSGMDEENANDENARPAAGAPNRSHI